MLRAALTLTVLLAACAGSAEVADVARDADGRPTEAGPVRADRLRVGDCFDDQDDRSPDAFPVVPCARAHDNEAFFRFVVPGDDFPGQDALADQAAARCRDQPFTDYVGRPFESSTLGVFYVLPSQETWERFDDRTIICALFDEGLEPLRGSARR